MRIHELIARTAGERPEQIAVRSGGEVLTYARLEEDSRRLALELIGLGVGAETSKESSEESSAETLVAVTVPRRLELFTALLGVLRAHGTLLPIDPRLPPERIERLLADSGCRHLVTTAGLGTQRRPVPHVVDLYATRKAPPTSRLPDIQLDPSRLAYVLYTSGSTGAPKGVAVEHAQLESFVRSASRALPLAPARRVLASTTVAFDISFLETLAPLALGMTVVLAHEDEQRDFDLLRRLIVRRRIDVVQLTPSRLRLLLAGPDGLECLRGVGVLLVGGEPFPPDLLAQLEGCECRIFNCYGPTETTIYSLIAELRPGDQVTIGRPLDNTTISIERAAVSSGAARPSADQPFGEAPGDAGELVIGGGGVARGYLHAPELTAQHFATSAEGARSYRTGDLVERQPDGTLRYLGRIDRQVKVRGHRVEPAEIEAAMLELEDVVEAAVLATHDRESTCELVGFFAPEGGRDFVHRLRSHLESRLPSYLVPARLVPLRSLPLTASGKVDARALAERLRAPQENGVAPAGDDLGPEPAEQDPFEQDPVGKGVRSIFSDVLGVETSEVGPDTTFSALGGHSLKAALALQRIEERFGVRLSLGQLFDRQTPRRLCDAIGRAARRPRESTRALPSGGAYPTSPEQRRIVFLSRLCPERPMYNITELFRIRGPVGDVDEDRIERAFATLVGRHTSLRCAFGWRTGGPVQEPSDRIDFQLERVTTTQASLEGELRRLVQPFDLSHPPLIRVALITVDRDGEERVPDDRVTGDEILEERLLLVDTHHAAVDGFSRDVLFRDFEDAYLGNALPAIAVEYADYVDWLERRRAAGRLDPQVEFWRRLLSDPPPTRLPLDRERPARRRFRGRDVHFSVPTGGVEAMARLAACEAATPFMALLSIASLLVAQLTDQDDIVLGTPVAGRTCSGLENTVGMFVNTVALRFRPRRDLTVAGYLREVRRLVLDALAHQEAPFDQVVQEVGAAKGGILNPLFDVLFVLQDTETEPLRIPGLDVEAVPFETGTSLVDLMIHARQRNGGLECTLQYDSDLFEHATVEGFRDRFLCLFDAAFRRPERRLAELLSPMSSRRTAGGLRRSEVSV